MCMSYARNNLFKVSLCFSPFQRRQYRFMSSLKKPQCNLYEMGLVPYKQAWDIQQKLLSNRTSFLESGPGNVENVVISLEHPHVFTVGRSGKHSDLFFQHVEGYNKDVDADVFTVERGGKVTYHGPGQLVVYPILNLRDFQQNLHWYVHSIEEVIIRSLGDHGVAAGRLKSYPGVWVNIDPHRDYSVDSIPARMDPSSPRKIAQVGMNCSKWYTIHGFAINVHPDMSYFSKIVPCGIDDRPVTSLERELLMSNAMEGYSNVELMSSVRESVYTHFEDIFGCLLVDTAGTPAGL